MKIKAGLVLAVALFLTGGVYAANSLDVNNGAAIEGNYGLEVLMDGSTNGAYVEDNTPSAETVYRASFWVDINDLDQSNCGGSCSTRHVMFLAQNSDTPPRQSMFRVIFRRLADDLTAPDGRYSVVLGCANDNADFVYVGGTVLRPDGPVRKHIWVEFEASSAAGADDGYCALYSANTIGGTPNLVAERTGMNNDTLFIEAVALGARSGLGDQASDADTTGSYFVDSFESYRTLLP